MDLHDRGILITGGGRGLGAALARELARRGARLLLVARSEPELADTAAAIRAAGGTVATIARDVADKDAVHAIAAAANAALGAVDAVVHCAGALGPVPLRPLADTACEDLQRALDVNLVGPFRLDKLLLGPMFLRGDGLVVHVSTDAAVAAYPLWGAYGVSKAAADHLARIWATELDGTGVRLLTIDPGEMDTRMHREAMPDADRSTLARPEAVAVRIADMMADPALASGARLAAATWRQR